MKYIIAIEPADRENPDFGVIIPDLPGSFSQGSDLDDAVRNAQAAAELWLGAAFDAGQSTPKPSNFDDLREAHPEWAGWIWAAVDIDLSRLSGKTERINVTLPQRVLRRLDALAKRSGDTRSGYIARQVMSGEWK
ncbi:type II toxin-antitoxin system HicB family antitoxin [Sutterella sp.]|uniref:type II toxin-antitoxin system HicB family antitoxin n=1 Tax=Sutterella sp. TaxID=1981025 RepID=UPI0026DF3D42|nr:type II toxin-antitoxin system HicB family antitoxin [Sutterella sp.]MDO5530908.1 type II toxin-antitoxin system HicB family antitoxin [Sutterella sp.]